MKIELDKVSKKYGSQWIYRHISAEFGSGIHAIVGANGSGKSTLLKVISGIVTPNEGKLLYTQSGSAIAVEDIYRHISYSAPYLDLPEELTLSEMIAFHAGMRPLYRIGTDQLLQSIEIPGHKQIRDCSSGMKQRIKFALAYHTDSSILLLDEPTANMDHHWRDKTLSAIGTQERERITIICSNEPIEYAMAEVRVSL